MLFFLFVHNYCLLLNKRMVCNLQLILMRNDVIDIEQNVKFSYVFEGRSRRYFADFLVTYDTGKKTLYEVKPSVMTNWAINIAKFDAARVQIHDLGIDEIYCISINDSFVMNKWAESQNIMNVKVIPDGSGAFTSQMGMTVSKDNLGFGLRSWRYAAIIDNGRIEKIFEEPGRSDDCETDPYGETSPQNILKWLEDQHG